MQVPTMHIFITLVYWNRKSDLLFLQAMTSTAIMFLLQVVKRWTLQIESYDFQIAFLEKNMLKNEKTHLR